MTDIVVVGAGPAGAAAATLLAAWGHDVVLIHRAGSDAARLAESIPPSAGKILRTLGALDTVRAAQFLPWRGNTVWWASDPVRVEAFPSDDAGCQVLRRHFDDCLRRVAVDAGARIIGGRVTAISRDRFDHVTTVAIDDHGGQSEIRAPFVIDASGRAGVIARELRVLDGTRRTIALAGSWRTADDWPLDDPTHTLVASYAGGWSWSVPVDRAVRQFTVMVDPSRSDLVRHASARDVYLAEIAKVTPFVRILKAAQLVEGPWGADASEYTSRKYTGEGFLLAGDAASTIDPLSSLGVKKALVSGWLAAVAIHTSLANPPMTSEAMAFFDRRERAVAEAASRQARQFAHEVAANTEHPFWISRAIEDGPVTPNSEPDASELARDPAVQAAFTELRSRQTVKLIPAPALRIEPRAAVRDREIVHEDHLVTARWPDGVRYLRGVDLVKVVRAAPGHADLGALFETMRQTTPGIALPDFLGALSVLLADGQLGFD